MTANGIEKQRENAVPLKPLPRLKVLRDTWCSQQTVDNASDFLQAHNPDLVAEILLEEGASRAHDYFSVMYELIDYLAGAGQPVPPADLGKLDLAVEISRRIRKANGLRDFKARGRPLAERPDMPLPPLANVPVSPDSAPRGNVTQELADRVLGGSYRRQPALWFAAAEEYRQETCIYATDALRNAVRQAVDADFGPAKNDWTADVLFIEAARRIYKMCGIEE